MNTDSEGWKYITFWVQFHLSLFSSILSAFFRSVLLFLWLCWLILCLLMSFLLCILHCCLHTSFSRQLLSLHPSCFFLQEQTVVQSHLFVQRAVLKPGIKWFIYSHILILVAMLSHIQTCKLGQIFLPSVWENDIHTSNWMETWCQNKLIHQNVPHSFN